MRYGEPEGLPSNDVHAVAVLSSGGVLVGTGRGAAIVHDGQITALGEKRGIPPGAVWAVAEGPKGTLLLGTSRGLLLGTAESRGVVDRGAPVQDPTDPAEPRPWLLLSMASGDLQDDWVTALASRGATLYVGTYNAGVTAVTMDVAGFTTEHLGGGYVNFGGLLVEGRTLFAGTMNGLLMRPASGEGAWRTASRAAPGKDVTALAPLGGKLWVASRRGLARFDPGRLSPADTCRAQARARARAIGLLRASSASGSRGFTRRASLRTVARRLLGRRRPWKGSRRRELKENPMPLSALANPKELLQRIAPPNPQVLTDLGLSLIHI